MLSFRCKKQTSKIVADTTFKKCFSEDKVYSHRFRDIAVRTWVGRDIAERKG